MLTNLLAARPGHESVLFGLILANLGLSLLVLVFGATAVVHRIHNVRTEGRWKRVEARWEEAVLAFLDGERTAEAVRALVQVRDRLLFVDFAGRFARRLRGIERAALAELARPFLPAVAARTGHRDDAIRARAVLTLGLLGFNDYVLQVVGALDDDSPLVAMTAARALARREHPFYAHAIVARLHRFIGWHSGFLAAMLAAMGPEAVPALLTAFTDRAQPPRARAVMAEALRLLNCLAAADPAALQLAGADDRDLAASCLRLLGQVGRREHLPAARALLASADEVIRSQAVAAVGALADPAEAAALRPALDDPSAWVALEAARALARIPEGVRLLHEAAAGGGPRAAMAGQALVEERAA